MCKFLGFAVLFSSLLLVSILGCTKSNPASNGGINQLTLGTGLNASNPFLLVGESTTFTGVPATIYFRLESKDDMGGSAVIIALSKMVGGVYTADTTIIYPSIQSYGTIFLSAFTIRTTGSYQAVGILQTGNKTIASVDFTVQ
jgi:hypothetical protein